MPYAVKQIVAQELELERLKRAAKVTGVHPENPKPTDATKSTATVTVPNHLRRIEPVPVKPKERVSIRARTNIVLIELNNLKFINYSMYHFFLISL